MSLQATVVMGSSYFDDLSLAGVFYFYFILFLRLFYFCTGRGFTKAQLQGITQTTLVARLQETKGSGREGGKE